MQLNKLKHIVIIFVSFLSLISCGDELERSPFSSIDLGQSFQTIQDAENWNNGLYASFRGRYYGSNTFTTDVQADQLNATRTYGNRNGSPHRWSTFQATDGSLSTFWNGFYSTITNANIALAGYDEITLDDADDLATLDRFRGDAYFVRAYSYSQLIIRFAKAYNASTASSDLGVPIVTEFDITTYQPRASVEAVYSQIMDDLASAKSFLGSQSGEQGAERFTIDAVLALEARVKMHMEDWPGAKSAADQLINSGTYPLYNTKETVYEMWVEDAIGETIFQPFVNPSNNEGAPTNNIYFGYNVADEYYTPDFVPSQWVVDMYDDTDHRKSAYFLDSLVVQEEIDYENITLVSKFRGNPDLFTSNNSNFQHHPKVFRIAEMYLISAEAGANGAGDGLEPLNALRVSRNLPALNVSGADLMQALKDERFRELAFEGFRLDDLKRWNEGFQRRDPQNLEIIETGDNFNTLTIAPGADKFVWGIPANDQTISDLVQNPGW